MSHAEDVIEFVEKALLARGALCERSQDLVDVVLPPGLAAELQLPEAAVLAAEPRPGVIHAGFGGALLERLLDAERGSARVVGVSR